MDCIFGLVQNNGDKYLLMTNKMIETFSELSVCMCVWGGALQRFLSRHQLNDNGQYQTIYHQSNYGSRQAQRYKQSGKTKQKNLTVTQTT